MSFMQVVDPSDELRRLHSLDLQVEYQTLLAATRQHALQLQFRAWIDLLMRNVGRHVDKIPRGGLGFEFQTLAPAQPGNSVEHVNHSLQVAVVMGAGFRLCVNCEGAGPELRCTRVLRRDRSEATQPRRLSDIGIELPRADDPYTI